MISNNGYARVGNSISARRKTGERSTAEFLNDARKVLAGLKDDPEYRDRVVIERLEETLSRYDSHSEVIHDLRPQIKAIKTFGRRGD